MVSKAKRLYMVKKSPFVISMEKWVMKLISARTSLKRATHQGVHPVLTRHLHANPKRGPKNIWVPKSQKIPITYLLDSRKETPVIVLGQWLLTTYDRRKVYVPILKPYVWWDGHFLRE